MSKTKIILGGVAVIAAASIGAHLAAPSFFENRIRTYLTNPNTDLNGSFDNFEVSLFGGTMTATNINLRSKDGIVISADHISMQNVNWLTLLGANPFTDVIAGNILIENGTAEQAGQVFSSSAPSLGDLSIAKTPDGLQFGAESGTFPDLVIKDAEQRTLTTDLLTFAGITPQTVQAVAAQNIRYSDQENDRAMSMETLTINDCEFAANLADTDAFLEKPFSKCEGVNTTNFSIDVDNKRRIKAASFAVSQITSENINSLAFNGVEFIDNGEIVASLGGIDLSGLNQSLSPETFNDDGSLDDREWQHVMNNLSFDTFSITDIDAGDNKIATHFDQVAVNGFKNGIVERFTFSGFQLDMPELDMKPSLKIGNVEVSKVMLGYIRTLADDMKAAQSTDPEVQMSNLANKTVADLGIILSPMIYESFVISDMSVTAEEVDLEGFKLGFDRINGIMTEPVSFDNSDMAFSSSAHVVYDGIYFELSENAPQKDKVAAMLGLDDFERISLSGKFNQSWDKDSGVYTYDMEDLSIDDFGSMHFTASVGNLPSDVMGDLLTTRVNESEKLQQIAFGQAGLDAALVEIKGEKLVKLALRLIAISQGQSPDELQMISTMILMQTQQQFAQFPKLETALGELVTWMQNPEHLRIKLTPESPVPLGVLAAGGMSPQTTADLLGLTVQANENVN